MNSSPISSATGVNGGCERTDRACARCEYPDSRGARQSGPHSAAALCRAGGVLGSRGCLCRSARTSAGDSCGTGHRSGCRLELLDLIGRIVQTVETETYAQFEEIARARLKQRDEDDWPVLAAALTLSCPIWTEDTDFFGCGVATWTTDRIELYLARSSETQSG